MATHKSINRSLIGQRFGRLLVLALAEPGTRGASRYVCECICGTVKTIARSELTRTRSDATRSCGCAREDRIPWIKHGQAGNKTRTRTYRIWKGMISRCTNAHMPAYERYGGRGIVVCEAWRTFEHFYADMGDCPPGLTLERRDNNGNYEPTNCCWATYKEQANNQRTNRYIQWQGETHTIRAWSEIIGMKSTTLYQRLVIRHWSVEDAMTLPPNSRGRKRQKQTSFTLAEAPDEGEAP